jgi:hypothetical protein
MRSHGHEKGTNSHQSHNSTHAALVAPAVFLCGPGSSKGVTPSPVVAVLVELDNLL